MHGFRKHSLERRASSRFECQVNQKRRTQQAILILAQPSVSSAVLLPLVLSCNRPCKFHLCLAASVQLPPRQVHINSSKLLPGLAR